MNKRVPLFLIAFGILAAVLAAASLTAQQPLPQPAPVAQQPPQPTPAAQPPQPQAAPAAQQPQPQAAPAPQAQKPQPPQGTPQPKPPTPQPDMRYFGPNVRVDVTITDQGTGSAAPIKKTISLTANRSSSIRSGVNVPIPQTTFGAAASGGVNTIPMTSYSYRSQGLSLDVRDIEVRDNLIRLNLAVEYSPLDESEKPATPAAMPISYSNFSQSFQLVLENGKPVMAAETSDPVPNRNRKLSVEVKATVLR